MFTLAFFNTNFAASGNYFNSQASWPSQTSWQSSLNFGNSLGVQSSNQLSPMALLSTLLGSSSSLGQNWSSLLGGTSSSLGQDWSSLLGGTSNSLASLLSGTSQNYQYSQAPPPPPPPPGQFGGYQGQYPQGPPPSQGQYGHQGQPCPPGNQQSQQFGNWGARQAMGNCQNSGVFGTPSSGEISQEGGDGQPISYTTSGGWKIDVNNDKTTFTDPNTGQTLVYSGDPHEYLNGEHIKDWEDKQRTVQLPDGTKVTLSATAANGLTTNTSIYDGQRNIQIDNTNNTVTSDITNYFDTFQREQAQYDGETARLSYGADGGLIYTDLYNQDTNLQYSSNFKDLATTTRNASGGFDVTDLV